MLLVVVAELFLAGPIVPSDTYCCVGDITVSICLIPATIELMSVELIEPVRSATTATSIGFGVPAPHEPLHATATRLPVLPSGVPTAGPKANGTSLLSATRTVLHRSPCAGTHGIAQSTLLQLRPGYLATVNGAVPGLQVEGICVVLGVFGVPVAATTHHRSTTGSAPGSLAWAIARAAAAAPAPLLGSS